MKTLDEVIKAYELCIHPNIRCLECPYHEDGCPENRKQDAFHYLLEYRDIKVQAEEAISKQLKIKFTEYNDPLTWDELKQMEGKPVWVEWISGTWKGLNKWVILSRIDDDYLVFTASDVAGQSYNGQLRLMNLGKTWQAYRKER